MAAWYNEIDPFAAAWLRELIKAGHIAPGEVDERSIVDVRPDDLRGFTQCHFFAGIGGWSYAARLAGWPDGRELWTGSCPCQPFSEAGGRRMFNDERHLWPSWFALIRQRRPTAIFGEQVAVAATQGWLDLVVSDLESENYACGAAILPAAGIGAPHVRDRLWFVAHAHGQGEHVVAVDAEVAALPQSTTDADADGVTMGRFAEPRRKCDFWSVEPAVGRVADGIPARVAKLRALGNAIVPQVAAEFIEAYLDTERVRLMSRMEDDMGVFS